MSSERHLPDTIQTIPAALAFWAEQRPDAPALRAIDWRQLSYGELHGVVTGIASQLRAHGVGSDDVVVLLLPPGFELCLTLLGAMAAGVAAPFDPAATAYEVTRDLARLPARQVVVGGPHEVASRDLAACLGMKTTPATALLAPADGQRTWEAAHAVDPDRIAMILHTSGTTGPPKRVPRTHRALLVGACTAAERTGLTPSDVGLVASGFYNISGLGNMFNALVSGGCCVVAPAFVPACFPGWIDEHQPTWMFAAPTHLNLLLPAMGPRMAARSSLRLIRAGTQAMTAGTIERAEACLGAVVFDTYGMTEASSLAASGPGVTERRMGSCGRILAAAVRVVDGDGVDVAPGASGEIVVRGPTVFAGYLDDPEATAATFLPGGWFRTGDVGFADEDEYLFLIGRAKEQINRGGAQIAPAEVEGVLLDHPAVAEAAIFAVPDRRLGEDLVAAVVFRHGTAASARELRSWVLDRLSPAKTPRRIWPRQCLPRTATGKVQRGALTRQWLEAHP